MRGVDIDHTRAFLRQVLGDELEVDLTQARRQPEFSIRGVAEVHAQRSARKTLEPVALVGNPEPAAAVDPGRVVPVADLMRRQVVEHPLDGFEAEQVVEFIARRDRELRLRELLSQQVDRAAEIDCLWWLQL